MINPSKFHDLVSGRQSGFSAALVRTLLGVAELPYSAIMRWRNWRYNTVASKVCRVDVPVISVGNLTTGGTGKTPMVLWLAHWFREHDIRVTLISRGYAAPTGSRNDEALELEQRLGNVPHLQNRDRVKAAKTAIEEFACQLIILDDAFQHRRIHRDLDIVLLDATQPFGFGHVLPRGLLREPIAGLARADVVVLTRSDMIGQEQRRTIRDQVRHLAPDALWIEATHQPQTLLSASGQQQALELFSGERVVAFSGIGNPDGFRHTLQQSGYEVVQFREFADHYDFRREDIESLIQWASSHEDIAAVVCTHKDLVKISLENLGELPLWALRVGLEINSGSSELIARLKGILWLSKNSQSPL